MADPVSLAAIVLAVPSAILILTEILERIYKNVEKNVEIKLRSGNTVELPESDIKELSADQLSELIEKLAQEQTQERVQPSDNR